jgi:hypothetical protein
LRVASPSFKRIGKVEEQRRSLAKGVGSCERFNCGGVVAFGIQPIADLVQVLRPSIIAG